MKNYDNINQNFVKSIIALNNYLEIFTFKKNYYLVQIKITNNYKIKIIIKVIVYIRLALKIFDNNFERKSLQMFNSLLS